LKDDYSGTWVLGVRPEDLAAWPLLQQSRGQAAHLWLVDPLGNLMMRFPTDADPTRIKTDLMKLLKASRIG
ncbi:MAG: cytochrome C oxidase subunit I, partial [Burkholderiaceae bacterium]|nr:cytochrome C oxidase subunit I [Burkholderiaceae bacterium]